MYKKSLVFSLLLFLIVFASFFVKIFTDLSIELKMRQWTFMVYADADNDLDVGLFASPYGSKAVTDLNEMETAGSTSEVAVVVQMDRLNSSALRYLVTKDNDENTIGSSVLQDLGEVNMGDPTVLSAYVRWAVTNFPAFHYCLIIWDHGLGFQGICKNWNGVSQPPPPVENLTMTELESALNTITNEIGKPLDIIGFDACLMQMTEVAYQLRQYATVMVGSEETIPSEGWPYHYILQNLTNTPDIEASQLAQKIEAYRDYYLRRSNRYDGGTISPITRLTLSALNLYQMNIVISALNSFASFLIDKYACMHEKRHIHGALAAKAHMGYQYTSQKI